MPATPDMEHRSHYRAEPGETSVDEGDPTDGEDGLMSIRLPIASTGVVRNPGDDPLTDRELEGMAEQVNALDTGVFPDHGGSNKIVGGVGGDYSQFEKLGYWAEGEIEVDRAEEGVDVLIATAKMPDPETLPDTTGAYREALAILKEQAKRGIPIDASIGWREDEDYPGGVDLMEASIVGIGADPRTSTAQDADPVAMVARAAVDAGADRDALVERVREATREGDTPEDARPFGPPGGDDTMWEDFEACVDDVKDWEDIDDPEAFCAWAEKQTADADRQPGDWEVHTPEYDGVSTAQSEEEWDAYDVDEVIEQFGDSEAAEWDDLTAEQKSAAGNLFIASASGFPAEDFSDMNFEVLTLDGELSRGGLEAADSALSLSDAPQAVLDEVESVIQDLAAAEFDPDEIDVGLPETTDDMSDTQSDDTTGEQTDDQRAPEDIEPQDFADLVSSHFSDMDPADAMDFLGQHEYAGIDEREVATFVGNIVDENTGDVLDWMQEQMDSEAQGMDEDDEEEQAADADGDERDVDVEELGERIADLEDALADVRSGDADVETPDPDEEQDADDEKTEQRDTTDDTTHELLKR